MKIQEYVDIKDYSTMKIGGQFRYFTLVSSVEELNSIWTIVQNKLEYKDVPLFVLGGGSNVIFSDGVISVFAIKMEIKGFDITAETDEYINIKVGAGELWDEVVVKTVGLGLSGFESLSAIPGTVGATPVQNVGAYGSEVKDTIIEVEVFDTTDNQIKTILNKNCNFGYRDSIFKNEAKGRYIIIAVIFKLKKVNTKDSLLQKREEIITIRSSKLPDPKEIPNVGSFFKNPIILKESFSDISRTYGEIPSFDVGKNMVKVPAGWLIENAGLKGRSFGKISVYSKNALILVNNGGATKDDLIEVKNEIIKIVKDKFGIALEQEPEMV